MTDLNELLANLNRLGQRENEARKRMEEQTETLDDVMWIYSDDATELHHIEEEVYKQTGLGMKGQCCVDGVMADGTSCWVCELNEEPRYGWDNEGNPVN